MAPPVYRPESKKIVQPKVFSPQQKSPTAPPVYRPVQKGTAQAKTVLTAKTPPVNRPRANQAIGPLSQRRTEVPNGRALPRIANTMSVQRSVSHRAGAKTPNVPGSLKAPRGSSVIQRAREMLDYPLNYVMVPDKGMEAYAQHVHRRTRHFFTVVLNAVREMQNQGGLVKPSMFTDHAKAQEARGFRLGPQPEDKYDAAHLMNTTLVPGAFPAKNEKVGYLYRSSAATGTQFQKANVGPDKRIDSQQTNTKNEMLAAIQGGAVVDRPFITGYVTDYLQKLAVALSVPLPEPEGVDTQARAAALRVVLEDLSNIESVVDDITRELS